MRHLLLLGLFVSFSFPVAARAQDPSPRAARLMALTAESPGVWLGPRRVWTPAAATYLSACAPGGGCAPIDPPADGELVRCAPPACPGAGYVHSVTRDVAPVGGFPGDYGGYQRELEALRADPALLAIRGHLADHPEHAERRRQRDRAEAAERREARRREEPVRWISRHRDGLRFELAFDGAIGTLAHEGGSYAGGSASFGPRLLLPARDSDDDSVELAVFGAFLGDAIGGDLRVHFLHRIDDGQSAQWIAAVGIGPSLTNRFEGSVVRLPTFFGVAVPEVGAIFRADRDAAAYVAWSAPVSFLVTHDFALDVTARLFLIDDWIAPPEDAPEDADDPAEVILTLSLGARFP